MPEYHQQEASSNRYLTEDGSGSFLLETSSVLATVTGGGSLTITASRNAHSTVSVSGGGTITGEGAEGAAAAVAISGGGSLTASGVAALNPRGGNLMGPPRRKHVRYGIRVERFGEVHLSGGGRLHAEGAKATGTVLRFTAGISTRASGSTSRGAHSVSQGGGAAFTTGHREAISRALVSGAGDWTLTATRTSFSRATITTTGHQRADTMSDALEMELRQLLEDALVLSEA